MRKIAFYMMVAMVVVLMGSKSWADGTLCESASDAENYLVNSEMANATDCIKAIIDDPKRVNTRAHFVKGKICLAISNADCAKAKFSSEPVKAKYGEEIYSLYIAKGDALLAQGDFTGAGNFYVEAISYNAFARQTLAKKMFEFGKTSGKRGYFVIAKRLDSSLDPKIAEIYRVKSMTAKSIDDKIDALEEASIYDQQYKRVVTQLKEAEGRGNLEQAKIFARKTGKENEVATAKYKALAQKYLGEARVESELPEVVEYNPRPEPYMFKLKAGEQTPYWIKITSFGVAYWGEDGCQYEILYDDGYISKPTEKRSLNKTIKFKLLAKSECTQIEGGAGFLAK